MDTAETGLRRVLWVRVTCSDSGAYAEAVGLGHRTPRTTRIALSRAARLSASGVPVVVRQAAG